jgi:two-component system sensor histidine kinase UhpB
MVKMRLQPRFWVLIFVLILPFAVIALLDLAMSRAPVIEPAHTYTTAQQLKSTATSPAELPAEGWDVIPLPARARPADIRPASAWYRVEFAVAGPATGQWAAYLGYPYTNVALYVNGEFIGDGGPMTAPVPVHRAPLLFRFPAGLLHAGNNLLELRSVHPYYSAPLNGIAIGPLERLAPAYEFAHAMRVTFKQVTVIVLVVLAVLIGAMARLRRRERAYAWFACGMLGWAAHIEIMLIAQSPFETELLWRQLQGIAIGVYVIGSAMFVNHYTRLRQPRIERAMLWIFALGAAALIVDPLLSDHNPPWITVRIWLPYLLVVGAYTVVQLVRALWRSASMDVRVLAAAAWLMIIIALRDVLIELDLLPWSQLYLSYSVGFVLCAVGVVLLRRIALAFDAAERARDELNERVREKTAELERNLVHTKDLERESALGAERERILQDMHDGLGGHLVQALAIATSQTTLRPLEEPLRACLEELRLMVDSLEPVNGDLTSVLGSLRVRISRRLALAGVLMHWHVDDLPTVSDLGPKNVLGVARIVQEAITNAIKHSGCKEITVHAGCVIGDAAQIEIRITDNGRGMDEPGQGRGHGLASMRRRAAELAGVLSIESSAAGTSVALRLRNANSRTDSGGQAPDRGLTAATQPAHS